MNDSTISFFMQCDIEANIVETYWYEPPYLLSPYQIKISDLFIEEDGKTIQNLCAQTCPNNEELLYHFELSLNQPRKNILVWVMEIKEKIYIHGIDIEKIKEQSSSIIVKDLTTQFIKAIGNMDREVATKSEKMIQYQFQKMQGLNNELLNTQRQLKKANIQLKQLNEELNNRLVKDALTGLVSRYQYRDEIDMTIRNQPNKQGVFVFIDIDNFKKINDTYGHRAGDDYLKTFAKRLTQMPFNHFISIRISGDEFGLYIHGYEKVNEENIDNIWKEIKQKVVKDPIKINSKSLNVSCSAGMAIYGQDTTEIYDLIDYADFAMYQAKNNGKNSYSQFKKKDYDKKKKM